MTDQEAWDAAIDENDKRDDASETEQADAAVRTLMACRNDRAEAARRLGWSRDKFDRRMALAELSDAVKTALDERRIKVGHAELLAAVPGDKQDTALETILGNGLDVNKTREALMRVTQNLGSACFDKGECTTCPFNSATQRALFETHVDDGHCTNRECFELKTDAHETAGREEQKRIAAAANAAAHPAADDAESDDDTARETELSLAEAPPGEPAVPATSAKSTSTSSRTQKAAVTAESIARRTKDLREESWRTAVARALARNTENAQIAILVAAMSGTLSQIKADTLTSRAGLLVGDGFADLDYSARIAEIRALPTPRAANVLAVVGAAYAKDAQSFSHVADLARAFDIDLRCTWQVDQAFLEQFTKDELRLIAQECGLVAHMGEKGFARLLGSKKPDLVAGMLNRTGFDWAGRLPSAMTLDGAYGPPPDAAPIAEAPAAGIAA
ncbi:hypothetical protein FHR21_002691 [Sphingopyxis panaciterrulae]|uniref:ParB/Spo0J HTH domain-containing protein n=2 Tax=Sphingopyxis panaciterrulae TaxID=462372 RepID=A0A7W9ESM6_9SPHN|nr:hypothetical protein [Sphingopyxis panaciterrulae]